MAYSTSLSKQFRIGEGRKVGKEGERKREREREGEREGGESELLGHPINKPT